MTSDFKAALEAVNSADECYQPETLEELRVHFNTIRRALRIADKLMQEPSDDVAEIIANTAHCCGGIAYDVFVGIQRQLLKEIEE